MLHGCHNCSTAKACHHTMAVTDGISSGSRPDIEGTSTSCSGCVLLVSSHPKEDTKERSFFDLDSEASSSLERLPYNRELNLEVPCDSPERSLATHNSLVSVLEETDTEETIIPSSDNSSDLSLATCIFTDTNLKSTTVQEPTSCQHRCIVNCNSTDCKTTYLEKSCDKKLPVTRSSSELAQSTPITFLLPTDCPQDSVSVEPIDIKKEMNILRSTDWFYGRLTWQQSSALLAKTPPGTFLIRFSSDPKFIFSLSVQTDRGPTSVRLHYEDGRFRLDATKELVPTMPTFPSVIKLLEYYITYTNSGDKHSTKEPVLIDGSGTTFVRILLTRPLFKTRCPSLIHLARLAIYRIGNYRVRKHLPKILRRYLRRYPYKLLHSS